MSFVWLPAIVLELGSQADHQLYWKLKQQVSPEFRSFFFHTGTLPAPERENCTAAETLTPTGLHTYLPGILVCGCCGFMTADLKYRCKGCLAIIEVPHTLLSGLEFTWASNKGWSWPMLHLFDMSQNISNPHAWTQVFIQAIGEKHLFSSTYNYTLLRDLHRKWYSQHSGVS